MAILWPAEDFVAGERLAKLNEKLRAREEGKKDGHEPGEKAKHRSKGRFTNGDGRGSSSDRQMSIQTASRNDFKLGREDQPESRRHLPYSAQLASLPKIPKRVPQGRRSESPSRPLSFTKHRMPEHRATGSR